MKKTTTLIIAFLLFSTLSSFAQVTLYGDDVYHSGSFNMAVDESGILDPGNIGPNQTWDFSSANADVNINFSIVSYSSSWNDANLVYVSNTDTFEYVKKTNDELITFLPLQNLNEFTFEPLTSMNFPLNYQDESIDSFTTVWYYSGVEIGMSEYDSVRINLKASLHTIVDAWGQISLPQGEFDALRVKSEHLIKIEIYTKNGNQNYVEQPFLGDEDLIELFSWYAPQKGYYIAEYDPETGEVQYLTNSTLGIATHKIEDDISVANPFFNQLSIVNSGNSNLELSLIDMNGVQQKQVDIQALSECKIEASELTPGMYILCISDPESNSVTYKKLIKN